MKKGFTLAEVLITLGIIGIVAALTIPTLIHNFQVKALKSQLLETFSLVNQAVGLMKANESIPSLYNYYTIYDINRGGFYHSAEFKEKFAKYVKMQKTRKHLKL